MIGRQWVLLKMNVQIHKAMSMRDTLNIIQSWVSHVVALQLRTGDDSEYALKYA